MEFGWHTAAVTPIGHITAVSNFGTFKYYSGRNLFELNTAPMLVSEIAELWKSVERANLDLRKAADVCGAIVLQNHIDKRNEDTPTPTSTNIASGIQIVTQVEQNLDLSCMPARKR